MIEPNPARFEECVINRATSENVHVYCAACVPFEFDQSFVEMCNSDLMSVALGLDLNSDESTSHAKIGSQFLKHSSLSYTFFANARTLNDILVDAGAPSDIDFLSLDVEGNELAVLKGLDFATYARQWILVESRKKLLQSFCFLIIMSSFRFLKNILVKIFCFVRCLEPLHDSLPSFSM